MAGKLRTTALGLAWLAAFGWAAGPLRAQDGQPVIRLLPGLGAEVFSRTITWDEDARQSRLRAALAVLRGEIGLAEGFDIGIFAGYGLTNPNGLVFRKLPFSLDYEAGSIGAILIGADLHKTIFAVGDYEIGLTARYTQSLGATSELEIASLNQSGTANARSSWQRVAAGPYVRYLGYEKIAPFLAVTFDKLWGEFTMRETIGDLTGEEAKSVAGQGIIGISLGAVFEPAVGFRLTGELSAIPYKKLDGGWSMDYGVAVRAGFGI
jgi:hypothetical protein